jgi:hypothetical protein
MTATSTQVRQRSAARRTVLARQQKLNEERQRRDEQELDLAAEFAVLSEECAAARAAVHAAELALGRVVDTLIGGLRIRYDRAAQLLDTAEDELKRLRQVAADATGNPAPPQTPSPRTARKARTRPAQRPTPPPRDESESPADPDHRGDLEGAGRR